jgi:hypothetical protein
MIFLFFDILIIIFVKDFKKLNKLSMIRSTHTMSFTICSKWAEVRDIAVSRGVL